VASTKINDAVDRLDVDSLLLSGVGLGSGCECGCGCGCGCGCCVYGLEFRVQGSGSGFRVWGPGFWIQGLGFRAESVEFGVEI